METVLYVLLLISVVALLLCLPGGYSMFYLRIAERDLWEGWEKVIENFDTIEYIGNNYVEGSKRYNPVIYYFHITIDGYECDLYYWGSDNTISVHHFPGKETCLTSFDMVHQRKVKQMLCEKFDFMREVIEKK